MGTNTVMRSSALMALDETNNTFKPTHQWVNIYPYNKTRIGTETFNKLHQQHLIHSITQLLHITNNIWCTQSLYFSISLTITTMYLSLMISSWQWYDVTIHHHSNECHLLILMHLRITYWLNLKLQCLCYHEALPKGIVLLPINCCRSQTFLGLDVIVFFSISQKNP